MVSEKEQITDKQQLPQFTDFAWRIMGGDNSPCPPERIPTYRQLDDPISTTAWGTETREEFFRR